MKQNNLTSAALLLLFIISISRMVSAAQNITVPDLPGGLDEGFGTDSNAQTDALTDFADDSSNFQELTIDDGAVITGTEDAFINDAAGGEITDKDLRSEGAVQYESINDDNVVDDTTSTKSSLWTYVLIIFAVIVVLSAGYWYFFIYAKKGKNESAFEKELLGEYNDNSLANYVKDCLKQGFTKEQVYSKFIESGYKPEQIDPLFRNI